MESLIKIEKQLHCIYCKELYSNPKLLPCYHSICSTCVKPNSEGYFKCLQCNTDFQMTIEPSQLPTHYLIESLLDIFKQNSLEWCELCDEEMLDPATSFCKTCEKLLCSHHSLNHRKTKITKGHLLVILQDHNTSNVTTPPVFE